MANTAPAATKDTASAMKAASRPKIEENTPPMAAPTANMTPQVAPRSELALAISVESRARFGMAASVAGLTTAARAEIVLWEMNTNQIVDDPTSSSPRAAMA